MLQGYGAGWAGQEASWQGLGALGWADMSMRWEVVEQGEDPPHPTLLSWMDIQPLKAAVLRYCVIGNPRSGEANTSGDGCH